MIQSRSVIGSVAGHGYYRPFLLEQLHQTLFIRRTGTGHDFKIHHTVQCFLITQLGESNSGDAIPLRIRFRIPKTDLTCDFRSGSRSITGHNLDSYTCRLTFSNCGRHIRTNRVGDGYDT